MGPMGFAPGSHRLEGPGRALGISDESEAQIGAMLRTKGYEDEISPYGLGDVSYHSGWVYHHAGPNRTDRPRRAMTMIYMDAETRLRPPSNPHEEFDAAKWCPGVLPGQVIDSPINPVLFSAAAL